MATDSTSYFVSFRSPVRVKLMGRPVWIDAVDATLDISVTVPKELYPREIYCLRTTMLYPRGAGENGGAVKMRVDLWVGADNVAGIIENKDAK